MKQISTSQLQRNQSLQIDAMDDLCNIKRTTFSTGTYSDAESYTQAVSSGVVCGIQFNNGRLREIRNNQQVLLLDYDVMLRLPASQTILVDDDIELVQKGGFMISGTFQPSSQPTFSSTVQHVPLKRKVV